MNHAVLTRSVRIVVAVTATLLSSNAVVHASVSVDDLTRNRTVSLHLRDGSLLRGKFLAVAESPESLYQARYAAWRDTALGNFPGPGDSVELRRSPRVVLAGEFRGFASGVVLVRKFGRAGLIRVAFADFDEWVGPTGPMAPASQLRVLDDQGLLPVSNGLKIETPGGTRFVALDQIQSGATVTSIGENVVGAATVSVLTLGALALVGLLLLGVALGSAFK